MANLVYVIQQFFLRKVTPPRTMTLEQIARIFTMVNAKNLYGKLEAEVGSFEQTEECKKLFRRILCYDDDYYVAAIYKAWLENAKTGLSGQETKEDLRRREIEEDLSGQETKELAKQEAKENLSKQETKVELRISEQIELLIDRQLTPVDLMEFFNCKLSIASLTKKLIPSIDMINYYGDVRFYCLRYIRRLPTQMVARDLWSRLFELGYLINVRIVFNYCLYMLTRYGNEYELEEDKVLMEFAGISGTGKTAAFSVGLVIFNCVIDSDKLANFIYTSNTTIYEDYFLDDCDSNRRTSLGKFLIRIGVDVLKLYPTIDGGERLKLIEFSLKIRERMIEKIYSMDFVSGNSIISIPKCVAAMIAEYVIYFR